MSRYPGFITLLLIAICLWVNIVRYPSVWVMVKGRQVGQLNSYAILTIEPEQSDPAKNKDRLVAQTEISDLSNSKSDSNSKTDVASKSDSSESSSVVSGIYSQKPAPVVDKRMKIQAKNDPADSEELKKSEVFNNAGLSGSEWQKKEKRDSDDSSKKAEDADSKKNGQILPVSGEETEPFANAVRLIPVEIPKETRYIPTVYYRAPGEEGTSPMDLENPVYGPADAAPPKGGTFGVVTTRYSK